MTKQSAVLRPAIIDQRWVISTRGPVGRLPGDLTRHENHVFELSPKTMARIKEGLKRYGASHGPLVQRMNTGGAEMLTPAYEVMRTLTTGGHQSIVEPFIVEATGNTYDAADPKHPQHGTEGGYYRVWPTSDPLRTLHGTASKGIVLDSVRGSTIATPTDDPMATQTTSYTRALLIPVEGRDGKAAQEAVEALRTQTTRNETGLLMPYYSANEYAKPTDLPMGTLTTVDRYALITLRGQNAPKPATYPLDTFAANGNHHALADVSVPDVEDCRFRMLEPSEIKRGMAFPTSYVMLGNKREQVKQAGNAVTPPAARDLIACVAESLGNAA